jgi:predicted transcriptional regulator
MFTIYIHCLEVIAGHSNGADMCTIGNMGLCFSMVQIQKAVRELEKDGFITRHKTAGGRVYKITDKAIEYCENVTRAYERVHTADVNIDIAPGGVFMDVPKGDTYMSEVVLDDTKQGVVEVSETPAPLSVETTKMSFPLYGEKTIHEYVQEIEAIANVRVTRADLANDIVTLTIESVPLVYVQDDPSGCHEFEECFECGGTCNYHEDWCPYNEA